MEWVMKTMVLLYLYSHPSLLSFITFLTTPFPNSILPFSDYPYSLSLSLSLSSSSSFSLLIFLLLSPHLPPPPSLFFLGQDEEEAEAAFNQKHALQKAKEVGAMSSLMSSE